MIAVANRHNAGNAPCSPMPRSGRRSIGWRCAPDCRHRGWRGGQGLIRPPSTNRSASLRQGRARWPSTESIAKALAATGTTIDVFVELISSGDGIAARAVPLLGFAEAGAGGYFDDGGFPVGEGWDEIAFPAVSDEHAYALEVSGGSMEPAYRDGDVIVVSPSAPIRRGDRVVVKTKSGEVMAKELKRRTAKSLELRSLNTEHPDRTLAVGDVLWIARIFWASQ